MSSCEEGLGLAFGQPRDVDAPDVDPVGDLVRPRLVPGIAVRPPQEEHDCEGERDVELPSHRIELQKV